MKVKIYMVLGFSREKENKSLVTLNFGNVNLQRHSCMSYLNVSKKSCGALKKLVLLPCVVLIYQCEFSVFVV